MELNGAVINQWLKEFVDLTLTRKFERVIHLVDSSTVLGYLHKEDARLKPYEGIPVAEIQVQDRLSMDCSKTGLGLKVRTIRRIG